MTEKIDLHSVNRLISRNNCGICGSASRSDKHGAKIPAMVLQSPAAQKFP